MFTKAIDYDKTRVSKVTDSVGGTTQYEYDTMGRIVKEMDSAGNVLKSYTYDTYGQLTKEVNNVLDKTFDYVYNGIGNILSVTTTPTNGTASTKEYTYDKDELTAYDGTSISYNSIGCPTTYNAFTASWSRGKLSTLAKGTIRTGRHSYSYTYNATGQRIGKSYTYMMGTSDLTAVYAGMPIGYNKEFHYDHSGRLIAEDSVNRYYNEIDSSDHIVYLYDESGIIGIVYTSESGTTATYYFQRNLLGDVIGIYDTSGNQVGGYAYDAWGNCTITLSTNSIASRNPIRYRGYYYDKDTGLYYLNSRYYSPEWRRFISPDDTSYLDPETPNGLNLYCYCGNDPINYCDPSGHLAISTLLLTALTCGLIAAGSNAIGQVVFNGATLENMEWERVAIAGVSGFLAGLIPGTGFASLAAQAVVSSAVDNGLSAVWLGDEFKISDVIFDSLVFIGSASLLKGITKITSNITTKIFVKGGNYSQYQHYYRSKGFNYSRMQVSYLMKSSLLYKEISDEVIKIVLDFYSSFMMYSYVE